MSYILSSIRLACQSAIACGQRITAVSCSQRTMKTSAYSFSDDKDVGFIMLFKRYKMLLEV